MGEGSQMHGKQFYFPSLQNSIAFDSCQNNGTPLRLQPFGVNDFSSAAEPIVCSIDQGQGLRRSDPRVGGVESRPSAEYLKRRSAAAGCISKRDPIT